ncbi:hypothetical protein K2X05_10340 [bacterium]|nr:hypothetical protein [bacterium]
MKLFLFVFIVTFSALAAAESGYYLEESQIRSERQNEYKCYQKAEELKKTAVSVSELVIPKLWWAYFDEDAIYSVYTDSQGSSCRLLENIGANDFAWSMLKSKRISGCYCRIINSNQEAQP